MNISERASGVRQPILAVFVLTCAIVVLNYCIWILDRGFELTDEAYYLLLAMYPEASRFYISAQHWLLDGFWRLAHGLVAFRAWGLAILFTSALVLASGIVAAGQRLQLISVNWTSRIAIAGSCLVCSLLYATTINLSPSYNLLAAAGAYSAAGAMLLYTARPGHWLNPALLFLAGAALGIEAICKASAGVASFGVIALWVGLLGGGTVWRKLVDLAAIMLGACAMIVTALLLHTNLSGALDAMSEGLALFRIVQVEPVADRLLRYLAELIRFAIVSFAVFALPLIFWHLSQRTCRRVFTALAIVSFVAIVAFGGIRAGQFIFPAPGGFLVGGTGRFEAQMTLAFVLTALSVFVALPKWQADLRAAGLILGLFLLPYSVAVGSGNSLVTQVVVSLASWGGLVALVACAMPSSPLARAIPVALMAATTSQIVSSSFAPYHMVSPLHEQDYPATIPDLGPVNVDAATREFIDDILAAVAKCSIAPGSPFLGLYNVPGVALLTGTVPLYSPWLNDKAQADFVLARSQEAILDGLVLAVNRKDNGPLPALPEKLAGFPLGYNYCGAGVYPYNSQTIEIWQMDRR